MKVEFDKSFLKSLSKINDEKMLKKIEDCILSLDAADKFQNIKNIKKLTGYKTYYRIRIGDFRLGLEKLSSNTVRLIIIIHIKDIYNQFP